jgi:hypothetical protein
MDSFDFDREFYDLIRARYCSRPYEAKPGVWVRCGSRLKATCESCAELYRGDWAAIARSGIFDEAGDVVEGYRYAFLTLTAPSFGKVIHRRTTISAKQPGTTHLRHSGVRHSIDFTASSADLPILR